MDVVAHAVVVGAARLDEVVWRLQCEAVEPDQCSGSLPGTARIGSEAGEQVADFRVALEQKRRLDASMVEEKGSRSMLSESIAPEAVPHRRPQRPISGTAHRYVALCRAADEVGAGLRHGATPRTSVACHGRGGCRSGQRLRLGWGRGVHLGRSSSSTMRS